MADESVLRIPAKLEGLDVILAFVSFLLDTHSLPSGSVHNYFKKGR